MKALFDDLLRYGQQSSPDNARQKGDIAFRMPAKGNAWITLYFSSLNNTIGIFLALRKGNIGDILYNILAEEQEVINNEIGITVWENIEKKNSFTTSTSFPDICSKENRGQIKEWFSEHINIFVNAFRHRIEQIMAEL